MSTTIDQNVVEMRFDNSHFEQNVSKSMSTLDKFKQSLKFDGVTKSIEQVGTASDAMFVKVSHGYAVLQDAIRDYATRARKSIENVFSELTIKPVTTGFQEYETQINSTQTILANTESKGSTIEDVNKALEQLNTYADKTIYNFTEMTRNIGTFTAAGVDLDTSVNAIQGIANLAAVSGSTSQQASTAMYQLSQALASGTVKLMDWNSVVNAGMGGQVFQDALKETARAHGIAIDDMIEKQGSFRETLSEGWITSEILTETLSKFTMATEGATEAEIAANRAKLKNLGYTDEQIEGIFKLGNTATNAATKVKTFTQLWDVMKETAQSGWSQSWKIIVGDFEEAKELLTPLADTLTGFINKLNDARNRVLTIALAFTDPITSMMEKLNGAGLGKIKDVIKSVGDLSDKLEYYQDVVNKVWRGDFNNVGDNPDRFDLLTKAGYDPRIVQDLVNKGYQYKLTVEDIEAAHEKFGVTMETTAKRTDKFNSIQQNSKYTLDDCGKAAFDANAKYRGLTDEQLKAAGLAEEEIRVFRALEKESDRLGVSIDYLADRMAKTDGRTLLIDSLKDFGSIIIDLFKIASDAWDTIFNPPSLEYLGVRLHSALVSLKEFSESIRLTDSETGELNETGEKIMRTFEGVFAALDVILTVVGGPLKIAFKAFTALLGYFNLDILDVTASIGDAIVAFRDWIDNTLDFDKLFEAIIPQITKAGDAIREWWNTLQTLSDPKEIANHIVSGFDGVVGFIADVFAGIGRAIADMVKGILPELGVSFSGAGSDFVMGFVNGIWDGIQFVGQVIMELGNIALERFKEILGIHSPSTETKAIGEFTIEGFIEGLKSSVGAVWDWIKDFGTKCLDFLGKFDWGAIFAGGTVVAMIVGLFKIIGALENGMDSIGDFFTSLKDGVDRVSKSISGFIDAKKLEIKSKAMVNFAIAIGILAAAIWVLAQLEWQQIGVAVLALGAVAGILIVLTKVTEKLSTGVGALAIAGTLLGIAGAILILGIVAKMAGDIDAEKFNNMVKVMFVLTMVIGILTGIANYYNKDSGDIATTLLGITGAMLLLMLVGKMAGDMTSDQLNNMIKVLGVLTIAVTALIAVTKLYNKDASDAGKTLRGIATAMLLLMIVGKLAGGMTSNEILNMIAVLSILTVAIAALTWITQLYNKNADNSAKTLLGMAAAMGILVLIGKLAGGMSPDEMGKMVAVLAILELAILGLVGITHLATDKQLVRVGSTILAMGVAIALMSAVSLLLGLMSIEHLAKGVIAVGMLGSVLALMIWATRGASQCKDNLLIMSVAIGVMAAAVIALSFISWEKLVPATLGLALLMGMFAVMTKASGNIQSSMATLIVMTVAIGVLAGAIWLLAGLPIANTISAAVSMSILLLALSGAMAILGTIAKNGLNALGGVIMLAAMAVPMLAFVGILALMSMIPKATENVIAISALMIAMTGVLAALALMGAIMVTATAGIIGLTALAVPMLAFVGIVAIMSNIENASANVGLLITLMGALTLLLGVLSILGPLALPGVAALAALLGVVTAFGALAVGVGALMQQYPELQEFLDTGIPVFEQLAHALGSVAANLITGFIDGIADSLPDLATKLSMFAENLVPFMSTVKMIDDDMLSKVGILAASILTLTAADMLAGIMSISENGSSLAQLGTDLSNFMINALPFVMGAKLIDPASMEGIKTLAETIGILTGNNIIEGLTSWFAGEMSLEDFGKQLAAFGPYMRTYAEAVAGIDAAAVEASANAASSLATMATNLPNSGGFLADLMGDNTMDQFGEDLTSLGNALKGYSTAVTGLDNEAITNSVTAAQSLSDLATKLPNSGGFLADLMGDNTMAQFGADLTAFGGALTGYSTAVAELDTDAIASSVTAASSLVELANAVPNMGGLVAFFAGDNDLSTFGAELSAFGTAMAGYASEVSGIDIDAMNASVSAAQALANLSSTIDNSGGLVSLWEGDNNLGAFGKSLKTFGTSMKGFSDEVSGINVNQVNAAVASISRIVNLASGISGANFDGLGSLSDNLAKVSKDGIDAFVKAFENSYDDVYKAGSAMIDKLIKGIESKAQAAVVAFSDVTSKITSGIRNKWNSFKSAGKYLGSGLVEGINAKKTDAYNAGYALGQAAVQGEKDGQQSKSPSKLTYQAGLWIGEGLIGGMEAMGEKVYNSGYNMGDLATGFISDTISRIADMVDSGIDAQPTIRPVLDLSDVQTGVNAIGGMFNSTSLGVSANVSAINSMMNHNGQNGRNGDIITAIDKLNKKMDNLGNTTYHIDGVTYDDGSNIATAVQTIARAALRERRV